MLLLRLIILLYMLIILPLGCHLIYQYHFHIASIASLLLRRSSACPTNLLRTLTFSVL
jgi:hypothetical protein